MKPKRGFFATAHTVWMTFIVGAVVAGCQSTFTGAAAGEFPIVVNRPAIFTVAGQLQAGLAPSDQARVDEMCPLGIPKVDYGRVPGKTRFIYRDGYVLEHSSIDKIPLWVAEHVTKANADGSMDRSDNFRPDPKLPAGERAELIDYAYKKIRPQKRATYDRGHQAPAGDQNKNEVLKDETFFLSNMCPQVPNLNQRAWKDLEQMVRQWAINDGELYVFTGPMFYDPKEEDPATATGSVSHAVLPPDGVAVPTHFYKIIIRKNPTSTDHEWQAIAFVMENREYKSPYPYEACIYPIRWIEERTGINFDSKLTGQEADSLETTKAKLSVFQHS